MKLPRFWATWKERRRLSAFPALLVQDLEILARALQAGSSFLQALQIVSRESDGALAREWRICIQELERGASLASALTHLETRVPIAPIRTLTGVVLIVQETGGNLAGILLNLAENLRQEINFQNKLRAMTAQGKLSGYVVSAMPFVTIAALSWLAPDLIRPLFVSSAGWNMLLVIVVMVMIGTFLIQKIVAIEV